MSYQALIAKSMDYYSDIPSRHEFVLIVNSQAMKVFLMWDYMYVHKNIE